MNMKANEAKEHYKLSTEKVSLTSTNIVRHSKISEHKQDDDNTGALNTKKDVQKKEICLQTPFNQTEKKENKLTKCFSYRDSIK